MRDVRQERTNNLVNIEQRGKTYDIITGARLPTQPTDPYTSAYSHDRRAHPSNVALAHPGFGEAQANFGLSDRGKTAPTLIGPIPDAHKPSWQPPSPISGKSPSRQFVR